MERLTTPPDSSTELNATLSGIMDGAANVCVILSSAPTTANGLLKEGLRGFYGGFVYETINGTTYKYTVTAV